MKAELASSGMSEEEILVILYIIISKFSRLI